MHIWEKNKKKVSDCTIYIEEKKTEVIYNLISRGINGYIVVYS